MSHASLAYAASAPHIEDLHRKAAERRLAADAGGTRRRWMKFGPLTRRRRLTRTADGAATRTQLTPLLAGARSAPHH
jgi:hypothetical protein